MCKCPLIVPGGGRQMKAMESDWYKKIWTLEVGLEHTHPMRDTLDTIDLSHVRPAADLIRQSVAAFK